MLVFENSVSWVYHYPEHRLLELEWVAIARRDIYCETLLHAISLARDWGVRRWLSNHLNRRHFESPGAEWMNTVALPRFLELRLWRGAVAEPEEEQIRRETNALAGAFVMQVAPEVRYFTDRDAAWNWLTEPIAGLDPDVSAGPSLGHRPLVR